VTQRTRTSFSRSEARRDRRYPMPTLGITIGARELWSANWSLGGFMLHDCAMPVEAGSVIEGTMRFEGSPAVRFTAEVVRVGPAPGEIGARFRELDDAAFDLLDRAISRRLFRRPGAG
jgi:hypothetical protein